MVKSLTLRQLSTHPINSQKISSHLKHLSNSFLQKTLAKLLNDMKITPSRNILSKLLSHKKTLL